MESFHEYMGEYGKQLEKGAVQKAYRGLMDYIMALRTRFKTGYPEYSVSGNIYYGYMDMTYFALFPEALKARNLKIAVVFIHSPFTFEAWLSGGNKDVQEKYWQLFKESGWRKYSLAPAVKGFDHIVSSTLSANPDFKDLDALTKQIESGTLSFIKDIEGFLAKH